MNTEPPERTPQMRHSILSFSIRKVVLISAALALPLFAFAQGGPVGLTTELPSFLWQTLALISVVIVLNGIFVAADTALELLRPAHVKVLDDEVMCKKLALIIEKRQQYIGACSIASQTLRAWMILLCFLPAPWLAHLYAQNTGNQDSWTVVFLMGVLLSIPVSALNLVFGELVPKSYSAIRPLQVATKLLPLMRGVSLVFGVTNKAIIGLANLVSKRFGSQASFALPSLAEEEIRSLVESAEEIGEIEAEESEMLQSVFEFGDTVAREVMTPRVDLESAPIDTDPMELLELMQRTGHSRIPLYEVSDDQIVGIIHVKDIISVVTSGSEIKLKNLMRPAFYIPETKKLHDLLQEMKVRRTQMAIVQDQYGGTAGIVTIEDIVEELVGDIIDEYDSEVKEVVAVKDGWIVEGRTNIFDLNDEIGSQLDSGEFDTIGGYVFAPSRRVALQGESIEQGKFLFTIWESDGRRIVKIKISGSEEISLLDKILS